MMNLYREPVNISNTVKRELKSCEDNTYILGRLAEGYAYYPASETQEVISTMKGGYSVVFYLEALSDIPNPIKSYFSNISDEVLFMGIDNDQGTAVKDPTYNYLGPKEQTDYWSEKLKGKLIRFKPKVVLKKGKPPFLNLQIEGIEGDYNGYSSYVPVPVVNMDNKTFEEKLKSESYIQLTGYKHVFDSPEYVVCGDYIYSNFEHWAKNSNNNNMWKVDSKPGEIIRIRLDDERLDLFKHIGGGNQDVLFIDSEERLRINDVLHDFGEMIGEDPYTPVLSTPQPAVETVSGSNPTLQSKPIPSKTVTPSLTKMTEQVISASDKSEYGFLKNLQNTTLQEGLTYRPLDLVNFHISIKTNPLTVVAGMSGTGKTQLARAYAQALGLNEADKTLLFLPITPSYLEPADILGYLNPTTGLYVPAETGLVEILFEAERNPENLYMVVFDEMNLSQVEHWFAPFLSLLELKPENRRLSLYAEGSTCHNSFKYKDSVLLGENIMFVGTINLDETTKDFSDRLLDRVNVVTLQKTSFAMMQCHTDIQCSAKNFDFEDFKAWVSKKAGAEAYTVEELLFFDDLHEVINRFDNQKGVSYRLINRIGNYINNIPMVETTGDVEFQMTKEEAIDLGIKQRLLTKLKGSERQIGDLIGTRLSANEVGEKGELAILFESEDAQAISSFEETLKEINRKALELGVYGFTN